MSHSLKATKLLDLVTITMDNHMVILKKVGSLSLKILNPYPAVPGLP